MTLLFVDGFDHYITLPQMLRKWTAAPTGTLTTNTRFNIGNAVSITGGGSAGTRKTLNSSVNTFIVGFAFQYTIASAGGSTLLQFRDAGVDQVHLTINTDGTLSIIRAASTVLGTTVKSLNVSTWYYIECKIKIDGAVGTYEIRVNGVTWLSGAGVNTRGGTANNYGNEIMFAAFNQNIVVDDLYVCDGSGTMNNDFLGDVRVETLYPSGAGTASQWTPNGAGTNVGCVSGVAPDDDTTYIETTAPGSVDTYQLKDLANTPANIYGLQAVLMARKTDAGSRFISEAYRIGGTIYTPATGSGLSVYDSYYFDTDIQELSPATTGTWTASEVNNLEAGIKLLA